MSTLDSTYSSAPLDRAADASRARPKTRLGGWDVYLFVVALLVPIVVPGGPGQSAFVDVINLMGMGVFALSVLAHRDRLQWPFLVSVILIAVGSLLATTSAISVSDSFVTLLQDFYLYLWFVFLVNVMTDRANLRMVRVAWVWAASLVAIVGLIQAWRIGYHSLGDLIHPKGERAAGTFYNANMYADYLVLSVFVILSLGGQLNRWIRWGAGGLVLLALVATKSNGGMVALAAGLAVWAATRAMTRRIPSLVLAAACTMIVALGVVAWWLNAGWGVGVEEFRSLTQSSFVGRMQHSAQVRGHIWSELRDRYAKYPLGSGPGSSRFIQLRIGEQEFKTSMLSKEAHSDYVGYAMERGPLGFLGLVLLVIQGFRLMFRAWKRIAARPWVSRSAGVMTAAMMGGLAASWVHSLVVEKLHFRHFWMFLAILCAFCLSQMVSPEGVEERAS